jgi:hypothetical protein
MTTALSTNQQLPLVMDCCLIIRWQADHPDRVLPDLPRVHAERLLEDLVSILRPHLRQLEILEQPVPGKAGGRIRLWDPCTERQLADRPPHSSTWNTALAMALCRFHTRPPEGE